MGVLADSDRDLFQQRLHHVCGGLKAALDGVGTFQRRLNPIEMSTAGKALLPLKTSLKEARRDLQEMIPPDEFGEPLEIIDDAARVVLDTLDTIVAVGSIDPQEGMSRAMRALRQTGRLQERLYPIRAISPHLDRIFLEAGAYDRAGRPDPPPPEGVPVGLHHLGTEEDDYARGSASLYVPESYDAEVQWPVVVALHGGSGHGRDFVWTWLREARSRGFILISPTSLGRTWSLHDPETDGRALLSILDLVDRNYSIDTGHILLTGMSDGGTFALACTMREGLPFTAFAPVAATLPPYNTALTRGKRICWIHGALDWMFPSYSAEDSCNFLKRAGADITLRLIDDLSHTYPRDENPRILEWFNPDLTIMGESGSG